MDYTILSVGLIALLPFLAFVINAFIVKKFTNIAVMLSCASIFGSFLLSARIFYDFIFEVYSKDYYIHKQFPWFDLSFGDSIFKVDMGIYIDSMTSTMLLMVTGVAFLIHIFSTYYMKDDARYGRFFVYLSLFTSAMLGLVLSDNLLSIFIFWEIMGFCSYSLIGFYYEKEEAGNASMKAFMTTRVGDVCFLLGILAIWHTVGNVNLVDIYAAVADGKFGDISVFGFNMALATFAGFCIFVGTIGKSAQFPLQIWLPDAMMGPTPCSALIHAATMVAAGVYLSLRMYPLMEVGGLTTFIAYIGAITAFGAATIALVQTDIKAVLAFSTISQLGYMVLGIGVGSYNAAFMHLITHAVFKACLFLSAGSVIHSLHDHHTHAHVQDMPRMGGLRKKMPFTFMAMMFCTLAISGVPFFSGFVSKDRILGDALYWGSLSPATRILVPVLGFSAAFLTAFYMFRMMFLTFFGEPRDKEVYDHCHEEKLSLTRNVPLLILSIFTLGWFYSGSLTGQGLVKATPKDKYEWFKTLIVKPDVSKFTSLTSETFSMTDTRELSRSSFTKSEYSSTYSEDEHVDHAIHSAHISGAILSILIAFGGIFLAFLMYIKKSLNPGWWVQRFNGWYKALQGRYYFDDFYVGFLIQKVMMKFNSTLAWFDLGVYDRIAIDGWEKVARFIYRCSSWFDEKVVDFFMVDTAAGGGVRLFSVVFRTLQKGKIQLYFLILILILALYILRLSV